MITDAFVVRILSRAALFFARAANLAHLRKNTTTFIFRRLVEKKTVDVSVRNILVKLKREN